MWGGSNFLPYADFFSRICFGGFISLLARRRRRSTLFRVPKLQIPLIYVLKSQNFRQFSRKSEIFPAYISLSSNLYAEKSAFKCRKKTLIQNSVYYVLCQGGTICSKMSGSPSQTFRLSNFLDNCCQILRIKCGFSWFLKRLER